jgi:Fic family protein
VFSATTYHLDVSRKSANSTIKPRWNPDTPHNQLSPLPPSADLETKVILKQCTTARAALAELKGVAELIPDQGMLIHTLPLLEAQSSSEIENIITTTDRLFQFREADEHADPATKEAIRYSYALLEGYKSLAELPLSTRTAELICTKIKGHEMRVRRIPGTAVFNGRTKETIYTPPAGEDLLRALLANLEQFLHRATDLDPLIRMSVAHYQFEAIHPFADGNGRTGRVLNSLFLIQENLLTLPILYLSRYIIQHRSDYYRLLLDVTRDEAWEPWVLYVIRGVEETALWTIEKIKAIRSLSIQTAEHIRRAAPKIYTHELVNLIFEMPYCRIRNVTKAGLAARQAASRYLKQLVEIGVLQERLVGREKLFVHPKLMQLLSADSNNYGVLHYVMTNGNELSLYFRDVRDT